MDPWIELAVNLIYEKELLKDFFNIGFDAVKRKSTGNLKGLFIVLQRV